MKPNPKRLTRLQVMLSTDELAALDNFRFEKRMPSLAAAIREILRRGLTATGFDLAGKGLSSSEFGVLESDGGKRSVAAATPSIDTKQTPSIGKLAARLKKDGAESNAAGGGG
jgi:hypothetical protein